VKGDDGRDVVVTDRAETASRPLKGQDGRPLLVTDAVTRRTVSMSTATDRAIPGTGAPKAEPKVIVAC
jgi:hypothetical protein